MVSLTSSFTCTMDSWEADTRESVQDSSESYCDSTERTSKC